MAQKSLIVRFLRSSIVKHNFVVLSLMKGFPATHIKNWPSSECGFGTSNKAERVRNVLWQSTALSFLFLYHPVKQRVGEHLHSTLGPSESTQASQHSRSHQVQPQPKLREPIR